MYEYSSITDVLTLPRDLRRALIANIIPAKTAGLHVCHFHDHQFGLNQKSQFLAKRTNVGFTMQVVEQKPTDAKPCYWLWQGPKGFVANTFTTNLPTIQVTDEVLLQLHKNLRPFSTWAGQIQIINLDFSEILQPGQVWLETNNPKRKILRFTAVARAEIADSNNQPTYFCLNDVPDEPVGYCDTVSH